MESLTDRVVLVTGASRGIGAAVAEVLAGEGARIVLAARTAEGREANLPGTLEETAERCRQRGAEVIVQPTDLSKPEDVETLAAAAQSGFGGVDVLVNNAAISFREEFLKTPMKMWERAFRVNVHAPAYLSQLLAPGMIERGGGGIVNISSVAAVDFSVPWLSYSATKAALEAFTRGLANELSGQVSVNAIRIEVPVRTEGYVAVRPRGDYSNYEDPSIIGDAVRWLALKGVDYSGNVLTVAELRELGAVPPRQSS